MIVRDLWLRLRAVIFRGRVDRELEEELAFHLEMHTRKHLADGIAEGEARRRARVRFGPQALIADQCRDARGISLVDALRQDVRYGLSSFRRSPVFALTVIGTIVLGLGLNTAVFTLFNAYVLRPLAVRDPDSLYAFTWMNGNRRFHSFSLDEFEQFRRENRVFSDVFGARTQLTSRIDGHMAYGNLVTGRYFQMLGVEAALGRTLMPYDAVPGADAVVVLSHDFWQRQFAGNPAIIGKRIPIRGYPCEIVGILRAGFAGLDLLPHDFWAPGRLSAQLDDGAVRLEIVGRLAPDVSVKSAEAALMLWAQAATIDRPAAERPVSAVLESRATTIPQSPLAAMLFGPILTAFGLVLLIACANVANMMLARGLARQREIGIRMSLGAARARIVRQLLTESVLLALPAAAVAFLVSRWTVDLAVRALFATMPAEYAEYVRLAPLVPDTRVFAFTAAAATGSAVMFGLFPALEATRPGLIQAARGEFVYDVRAPRPRNALVVLQITASVCLLVCAALLLRAANRFANVDTGLNTRDVIEIYIREKSRPRVLRTLESVSMVRTLAAVSSVPLDATAPQVVVSAAENPVLIGSAYRFASPEFFTVFDIPLVSGRAFTSDESTSGADVAVISRTAARRLWPDANAVGQTLRIALKDTAGRQSDLKPGIVESGGARPPEIRQSSTVKVIGVSADIATGYLDGLSDRTAIFLPASARDPGTVLVVRVAGDVEAARRELDTVLSAGEPGAVDHIHKMQALAVGRLYPFRLAYV
jgi:predicted permease